MCRVLTHGHFGLVTGWFTIAYHPADLSLSRGSGTFTNHYHRGEGPHIDLGVGVVVLVLCRVITIKDGGAPSGVADTMAVGVGKIFRKKILRPVSNLKPMVVKLVGQ